MRVEIKKIQRALGITAVYVTHDRTEAMSLSDRVIVMKNGVIRQIGTPSEIYQSPDSRFVAGFVGKAAFFPVTIKGHDGEHYKADLGGKIVDVKHAAPGLSEGRAVIMARPESLRIKGRGEGSIEGRVKLNVYLGSAIESFVDTPLGEVLVEIDDPYGRKIYSEGEEVSIDFAPDRVRLLAESEE